MEQKENQIHFRKTLYFRMIVVILFLGIIFLGALYSVFRVSRNQFEKELSHNSDTLAAQICQNVNLTLKGMAEAAVPLTATNDRLGPILGEVHPESYYRPPYLYLRVKHSLDEFMELSYDTNWIAVVDSREAAYLSCRDSRIRGDMPDNSDIVELYQKNKEHLEKRLGRTIWVSSGSSDAIILMRSIFDSNTMRFCGCIMAELASDSLQEVFDGIDFDNVGTFTLYDQHGTVLYSAGKEIVQSDNRDILQAEYPIDKGMMKIVHTIDIGEKNQKFTEVLNVIVCIGLLVFVSVIILLWSMFGKMAKNLQILLGNLNRVSRGEFELTPVLFTKGDELDILAMNIQEMSQRIKKLMEQVVQDREIQEINRYKLLEMRYHELQSQVNPHFLFNILQSINGIAQINGDKRVSRLICMLAKFFRGNIDRHYTACELKEELEYAKNYMELYKEIYPDRLNIQWDVDESLLGVNVPTYILQPIVENSLVHGMEPSLDICSVRISVRSRGDKLIIQVWDNGNGIEPGKLKGLLEEGKESKRIGISNVQKRIQILYGKEYGLRIQSEYHHYTQVEIILPLPSK